MSRQLCKHDYPTWESSVRRREEGKIPLSFPSQIVKSQHHRVYRSYGLCRVPSHCTPRIASAWDTLDTYPRVEILTLKQRTYADRIELNKFQIGSLTKLYQYSKEKIAMEDSDFEDHSPSVPGSGAKTPMQLLSDAHKKGRGLFRKAGDVAGKVAGDFTGKTVTKSTHPRQVVLTLLADTPGKLL